MKQAACWLMAYGVSLGGVLSGCDRAPEAAPKSGEGKQRQGQVEVGAEPKVGTLVRVVPVEAKVTGGPVSLAARWLGDGRMEFEELPRKDLVLSGAPVWVDKPTGGVLIGVVGRVEGKEARVGLIQKSGILEK